MSIKVGVDGVVRNVSIPRYNNGATRKVSNGFCGVSSVVKEFYSVKDAFAGFSITPYNLLISGTLVPITDYVKTIGNNDVGDCGVYLFKNSTTDGIGLTVFPGKHVATYLSISMVDASNNTVEYLRNLILKRGLDLTVTGNSFRRTISGVATSLSLMGNDLPAATNFRSFSVSECKDQSAELYVSINNASTSNVSVYIDTLRITYNGVSYLVKTILP